MQTNTRAKSAKPAPKKNNSSNEFEFTKDNPKINFRCSPKVYDAAQIASDDLDIGIGPVARMALTKWLRAEGYLVDKPGRKKNVNGAPR